MGLIYPAFFFGAFVIAGVIFLHRQYSKGTVASISLKDEYTTVQKAPATRHVQGIGLYLKPDNSAALSSIQNLTQAVEALRSGKYTTSAFPHGAN